MTLERRRTLAFVLRVLAAVAYLLGGVAVVTGRFVAAATAIGVAISFAAFAAHFYAYGFPDLGRLGSTPPRPRGDGD